MTVVATIYFTASSSARLTFRIPPRKGCDVVMSCSMIRGQSGRGLLQSRLPPECADCVAPLPRSRSVRPLPVRGFRLVHAVLVRVVLALDLQVAEPLLGVGPQDLQPWHAIDH